VQASESVDWCADRDAVEQREAAAKSAQLQYLDAEIMVEQVKADDVSDPAATGALEPSLSPAKCCVSSGAVVACDVLCMGCETVSCAGLLLSDRGIWWKAMRLSPVNEDL
jgi:hypothetical protein